MTASGHHMELMVARLRSYGIKFAGVRSGSEAVPGRREVLVSDHDQQSARGGQSMSATADAQCTYRARSQVPIGAVRVKEGALDAQWTRQHDNAVALALSGNRIGVLENRTAWVKEGALDAQWTRQHDECVALALSGNRIGVLQNGVVWVKEGALGAQWTRQHDDAAALALSGNRIGVLKNGVVWVKEGALDAQWTRQHDGCVALGLSGNRIGVLQTRGSS